MLFDSVHASTARLIIRVYFIVLVPTLSFFAQKTFEGAAQLSLILKGYVPILHTIGWLQGFSLFRSIWDLRALPGGNAAFALMLLTTVLSAVSDLAVTKFVTGFQTPAQCGFGGGLVFVGPDAPVTFSVTPQNGAAYDVVHTAQNTSLANGGSVGIYRKVNSDRMFRANEYDVLGSWNCTRGGDHTYSLGTTQKDIASDLQDQGVLFDGNYLTDATVNGSSTSFMHFVVWTSSVEDEVRLPFEVKAAVQINDNVNTSPSMRAFYCKMKAPSAEHAASEIWSKSTLEQWTPKFQGNMYSGSGTPIVSNAEDVLAQYLNSMLMIQGGNNYLLAQAPSGQDTQGCLVMQTNVPIGIIALMGFVLLIALTLLLAWVIEMMRVRFLGSQTRHLRRQLPDGLFAWMVFAVREQRLGGTGHGMPARTQDLKKLNFMVDPEVDVIRVCEKKAGGGQLLG